MASLATAIPCVCVPTHFTRCSYCPIALSSIVSKCVGQKVRTRSMPDKLGRIGRESAVNYLSTAYSTIAVSVARLADHFRSQEVPSMYNSVVKQTGIIVVLLTL